MKLHINFNVGDAVKYDDEDSSFTCYGKIVKVNKFTVIIGDSDGTTKKVAKRLVNFD